MAQLQTLGSFKASQYAEWVADPFVVQKKQPAIYRLTIDYLTINVVRGIVSFAKVHFCYSYCHGPFAKGK